MDKPGFQDPFQKIRLFFYLFFSASHDVPGHVATHAARNVLLVEVTLGNMGKRKAVFLLADLKSLHL